MWRTHTLFNNSKLAVSLVLSFMLVWVGGIFGVQAQDSELRIGLQAVVNLDPSLGSSDPEITFNMAIYDYLIDTTADGSLTPNLAQSWDVSEDGLTYSLALVEGATFHDGSAFTSADVVYTFNRLKEIESPALNLLGSYEVTADGDNTVVFTLEAPNADFAFGLSGNQTFVLKDGTTEPNILADGDNPYVNFVGTGPFVLTDFVSGESATFARNADYWWDAEVGVDSLVLVFIDDAQAQLDAIKSGSVDFIYKVGFDRVSELTSDGLNILVANGNRHPVIRIRSDEGSLGEDVRVRQAFKLATDRELLNLDLFDGVAIVGNNDPIGPKYGPLYDDSIVQDYDPQAACDLLADAGYADGLGADDPIQFHVVDAFNYGDMGILLQQQWEEGCINVEILIEPENIYYGDDGWMEVELGVTGWGDRPTPQGYLSSAYASDGTWNESHWSDEEVDGLIAEAKVTADIDARAGIYSQISQIFAERGPIIVPFFAPIIGATGEGVEGVDLHPFAGRTDLRTATVNG
jgi:peptide/nickel transport system substrate-binding protein